MNEKQRDELAQEFGELECPQCGETSDKPFLKCPNSQCGYEIRIEDASDEIGDELVEAAIENIAKAADLLGWNIAIHKSGKDGEFVDGIIVGHQKYLDRALDAFDAIDEHIAHGFNPR